MNIDLLEGEIKSSGLTKYDVAEQLSLSYTSLQKKITGKTQFKLEEIKMLVKILHLNKRKKELIFFADSVH